MGKKINRTGEESYNNFGSKMIISKYRKAIDIDIYFPEYNWTSEHAQYNNFKKGKIPEPFYSKLKTAMYNYEVEIDD